MPFSIACSEVVPGCGANFDADDEEALMAKIGDHARDDHGMADIPDDVREQVRQAIRNL